MNDLFYVGRYKNKCADFRQLAVKWLCMNPQIKDGDDVQGKTILLNLEKINRCVFYPIKKNMTVSDCNFIGSNKDLKGEMLNQFNLMIYQDRLSVVI